jgi:hypothetical protein
MGQPLVTPAFHITHTEFPRPVGEDPQVVLAAIGRLLGTPVKLPIGMGQIGAFVGDVVNEYRRLPVVRLDTETLVADSVGGIVELRVIGIVR